MICYEFHQPLTITTNLWLKFKISFHPPQRNRTQFRASDQNPEYSSLYDNTESNMGNMARDNNPQYGI